MLRRAMDPLATALIDARERTLVLVSDLDDARWMGPRLAIVNPIRWEVGHLAWFQELWTLRHPHGGASEIPGADALYDSARVAHDTRWDLPLLDRAAVLRFLESTLARSLGMLERGGGRPPPPPGALPQGKAGGGLPPTRQTPRHPPPPPGR